LLATTLGLFSTPCCFVSPRFAPFGICRSHFWAIYFMLSLDITFREVVLLDEMRSTRREVTKMLFCNDAIEGLAF
jgi:hypothetical protein